jgi:hypothetical protein
MVCWIGGAVAGAAHAPAVSVVFLAGAVITWAFAMRANIARGRARVAREPVLGTGIRRDRAARAVVASWMLPGLGEWLLGVNKRNAAVLMAAYLTVAIPLWAQVVPVWLGVAFALPLWILGQYRLRAATGWGWSPLLPSWAEMADPDEPDWDAPAAKLAPDDPRRGWHGRS